MPFSILQSIKKSKLDKMRSKSTADLFERGGNKNSTETFNQRLREKSVPDLIAALSKEHKSKSRSRLQLFAPSKNDIQDGLKESKVKGKKAKTTSDKPVDSHRKDSSGSSGNEMGNPTPVSDSEPGLTPPSRSMSCFAFTEPRSDRRMSDIAQLDQYIDYYLRHPDDGNSSNRLCCAQMLMAGMLMAGRQMHPNGLMKSHDNLSVYNSSTSLCGLPGNVASNHFLKYRPNQRRRGSQLTALQQHIELRQAAASRADNKRRSSAFSDDSDDKEEYGPVHFTSGSDIDIEETEGEYDTVSNLVTSDVFVLRDLLKKPKFMAKRRSMPVLTADIEIF